MGKLTEDFQKEEGLGPADRNRGLQSPSALCHLQLGLLGLPGLPGLGWTGVGLQVGWSTPSCIGVLTQGVQGTGPYTGQQWRKEGLGMTLIWELAKASLG